MLCHVVLGSVRLGYLILNFKYAKYVFSELLCYVGLDQVILGQVRSGYAMLCYMLGSVSLVKVG